MKKLITVFTMAIVLGLGIGQTAKATDGLMKRKTETVSKDLSVFYSSGVLLGPDLMSYSATGFVPVAWSGDPLPAGAYYYINDFNIEYQSAGFPGSEGSTTNIPMSAFGGPGTYQIGIVYWDGGILYNYVMPISVTLL